MKKTMLLVLFALTACTQAGDTNIVLPQFAPSVPSATPFIDPLSYPTAELQISKSFQTANGFDVRIDHAFVEGKNVMADVCFNLPDHSDWGISYASLIYGDVVLQEYGTTLLQLQEPADGKTGFRCDTLTFVVPPDADLSSAVISIEAIAAKPREGEYCSVYLPKIQQAMQTRGVDIVIDCVDVNGVTTMQILSYPPEMTKEQAEQIVYSDEFYTVRGPWTFPLYLSQ